MTSHAKPDQKDSLPLPGLDGSNPLGFLAALGLLRILNLRGHANSVRMLWEESEVTWRPRVVGGGDNVDELLERLSAGFRDCDYTSWELDMKLPFEAERLRNEMLSASSAASYKDRDRIDTLGSFGVECARDDKDMFKDTSLRMVRTGDSAGNGLLAYGKKIQSETTTDNLRSALTEPWRYEDEGCALRWDPNEHHGYAMQWTDPSKEKTVSVRGANRLALAAMPMLPAIPMQTKVGTVAFGTPTSRQECLSWPLWTFACGIDVAVSLLALSCLQDERPDSAKLYARGVGAVYRCDRAMTSKYYRNFTPAQRIA